MKYLLTFFSLIALVSCKSDEEYLVFGNGSKMKKSEIVDGFKKGCTGEEADQMPEYIDQGKYCDCMLDQILNNSERIDIDIESDNGDEIMASTMEYFTTDEGMDMVLDCLDKSMDESKYDWVAGREEFMVNCLPLDTEDPEFPKMEAYCSCVFEKIEVEIPVMTFIRPEFAESEELQGYIATCAAEHEVELAE